MQDSEKDYPSQPIESRPAHHSPDDASLEADDSEYEPAEIQLPPHGLLYAVIVGVCGGLIAASIPIAIVLANASVYQEAARLALQDKISPNQMNTIADDGRRDDRERRHHRQRQPHRRRAPQ